MNVYSDLLGYSEMLVMKDGDKFLGWLNNLPDKDKLDSIMGMRVVTREWMPENVVIITDGKTILGVFNIDGSPP